MATSKKTNDAAIGERKTNQRLAIAETIRAAKGPMTVDDIHAAAQAEVPNLGMATVYRTVRLLLEAQEIQTVMLPDGLTRYEAADLDHHHHFRCRVCGDVFDLDICPVSIPKGALPRGFTVEDHELTFIGTCPECS